MVTPAGTGGETTPIQGQVQKSVPMLAGKEISSLPKGVAVKMSVRVAQLRETLDNTSKELNEKQEALDTFLKAKEEKIETAFKCREKARENISDERRRALGSLASKMDKYESRFPEIAKSQSKWEETIQQLKQKRARAAADIKNAKLEEQKEVQLFRDAMTPILEKKDMQAFYTKFKEKGFKEKFNVIKDLLPQGEVNKIEQLNSWMRKRSVVLKNEELDREFQIMKTILQNGSPLNLRKIEEMFKDNLEDVIEVVIHGHQVIKEFLPESEHPKIDRERIYQKIQDLPEVPARQVLTMLFDEFKEDMKPEQVKEHLQSKDFENAYVNPGLLEKRRYRIIVEKLNEI